MGLYEIHSHTREVSACSKVFASRLVKTHLEVGFDGVCITDHYHMDFYNSCTGMNDREIVDKYLSGYRQAVKEAQLHDFKVFWGIEVRLTDTPNDYLIYGMTEELFYKNPRIHEFNIQQLSCFVRDNKLLLIQAHPFRDNMVRVDPQLLDGVEAINGNPRHEARNNLSIEFAKANDLIMLAGSDFHRECDVNLVVLNISEEINDNKDLAECIRNNRFQIMDNRNLQGKALKKDQVV